MLPRVWTPVAASWCSHSRRRLLSSKPDRKGLRAAVTPPTSSSTTTTSSPTSSTATILVTSRPQNVSKKQTHHQQLDVKIPRDMVPVNEAGVPALFVDHPATLDMRRSAIESRITPRKYEQSLAEETRGYAYVVFAVIVGGVIFALYRVTRAPGSAADKAEMEALAHELRIARRKAKQELLAISQDHGECVVPRGSSLPLVLRWWSSGPVDADVYVVLVGEDGESAAIWGSVHAGIVNSLQRQRQNINERIRVVSFHRKDTVLQRSDDPQTFIPLSLRVRDVELLVDHLWKRGEGKSSKNIVETTSSGSWIQWMWNTVFLPFTTTTTSSSSSSKTPPQLVLIRQGQGCWAGLAQAGLTKEQQQQQRSDSIHTSKAYPNILATISVAPLLMHRGRHMGWIDAIPSASQVQYKDTVAVASFDEGTTTTTTPSATAAPAVVAPPRYPHLQLSQLLDPPSIFFAQQYQLTQAMRDSMDALVPQRKEMLSFWDKVGSSAADQATAKRFAEDLRRQRALESVLSKTDMSILQSCGHVLAKDDALQAMKNNCDSQATSPPTLVRALTFAPDALPLFIPMEGKQIVHAFFTFAANSLGMFLLSEDEKRLLQVQRERGMIRMTKDLSHTTIPSLLPPPETNAIAETTMNASKNAGISNTLTPSAAAAAFTSFFSNPSDILSSAVVASLPNQAESFDELHLLQSIRRIPAALGLISSLHVEDTQSYKLAESELAHMPSFFKVTLVHTTNKRIQGKEGDAKKQNNNGSSSSSSIAMKNNESFNDVESTPLRRGVVSIPLQLPQAIVDEVLDVLSTSSATSADNKDSLDPAKNVHLSSSSSSSSTQNSSSGGFRHWYNPS